MNVIDLNDYRQKIAKAMQLGETEAQKFAGLIVGGSIQQAERAFAVAEPIRKSDEEISRIIYRGARRELRAVIRKASRAMPEPTRVFALEKADEIYRSQIIVLCEASETSAKLQCGENA